MAYKSNWLIVFGVIEYIGNEAIVQQIDHTMVIECDYDVAEEADKIATALRCDYLIPQDFSGTIKWNIS